MKLMIEKKDCDIIICIHNSPRHLRWCLESIYRCTKQDIFNLILVDDYSDGVTKELIEEYRSKYQNIQVIENQTNLGYVKSANEGIRHSVSDNIVLINSDIVVTEKWLDKFLEALKRDPKIGLISPLTNNGANLTIKMPPGFDYVQLNYFIEKNSKKIYPDAMTIVGHCLLITRTVLNKIGLFDEIYSPAYTEETDYHFKTINNGFRAVIADDTYVYHKGEGSIANRNELFQQHLKIFLSRHGSQFKKLLAEYDKRNELGYLRDQKSLMPLTNKYSYKPDYDVVFLLPSLAAGVGGIATVLDIVNGLICAGLKANVSYFGKKSTDLDLLFEPIQYDNLKQFVAFPPNTKVLVATEYGTVDAVSQVAQSHQLQSSYFIQDYEGWFEPNHLLNFVRQTYKKIENRIVVSHWLHNMLKEQDECDSTVINVGIHHEEFYEREKIPKEIAEIKKKHKIIVLSLVSNYERRGSVYFIEAMRELLKNTNDIAFAVTQRKFEDQIGFSDARIINLQMLERADMARYFSACDVLVDASLYHGFGLPGLEGMSCGLVGILTNVNLDYAKNGENCILVQPKNVKQIKDAIIKLRDNPDLLRKMKIAARKTAIEYSWNRLVPSYTKYFKDLIASYSENKKRPDFGYEKLLELKKISEIISAETTARQSFAFTKVATPRELIQRFSYYTKEYGLFVVLKETLKWLFK